MFGPALLAYGHSIAVVNEHVDDDEVMAAYFKASQLIAGCHLPQLYIKFEYSLTNNIHLAEKFFFLLEVALNGLFVHIELGMTVLTSQLWSLKEGGEFPERRPAELGERVHVGSELLPL